MAGRYDSNPFAEEEEVNPFSVSVSSFDSLLNLDAGFGFLNIVEFGFEGRLTCDF